MNVFYAIANVGTGYTIPNNDRDRAFTSFSFVTKNNLTRAIIYSVGCIEIAIVT